jgi:hypothetical protein
MLMLRLLVVFYTAASTAFGSVSVSVTLNHRQSRLIKGRSGGLPLAESVLVVVFLSHIVVLGIPVMAGTNGSHGCGCRYRYRYRWFRCVVNIDFEIRIDIESYR